MNAAWSWFIIVLVVINLAGISFLLWWTGKRRPGDPAPEDTSHYWDGDITEYNKPMPRWWINSFWLTLIFGIGYFAWYGGFGSFGAFGGWSSRGEHAQDQAHWGARLAATLKPYAGQSIDALAADPAALAIGRSIFANTCAACHGSSGQGAVGYPNLTDSIWHWGGSPDQVLASVLNGRQAAMPALGAAVGGEQGIRELAVHVQALAGEYADPDLAAAGAARFAGVCAACHGPEGKGNALLGAPDLTDRYTLYGNDAPTIRQIIRDGRNGQMPAHVALLGETRARLAAAYAWSLSQPTPAKP